jgi:Kdo2-lipid IVA lauroyltransferase/acyltransferase
MVVSKKFRNWFSERLRILSIILLKGISYLPFPVLYGLSDFMALLLYHVVRYRRKVVHTNLKLSFPDKSEREISGIERRFYHFLSDYMLEILKGYSITRDSLGKRITFRGCDEMNQYAKEGKSVLLLGMHYGNTEWSILAGPPLLKHQIISIANPLRSNSEFKEFLTKIREKEGGKTIPVDKSARVALDFHRMALPTCLVLVGDQRPPAITHFWTTFMVQEACFNPGPVKIARKVNQPIFFHMTRRIKRGHYEVSFIPMIENPAELSDNEILLTYVRKMEKYIREAPEYYLWSHRRWIQKRPEGFPIYG